MKLSILLFALIFMSIPLTSCDDIEEKDTIRHFHVRVENHMNKEFWLMRSSDYTAAFSLIKPGGVVSVPFSSDQPELNTLYVYVTSRLIEAQGPNYYRSKTFYDNSIWIID